MNGIQAFLKGQRNRNFATSAQLTLGQIIDKLEKCGLTHGDDDEPKQVDYDFASAVPTTLDSWRGAYEELALGFKLSGYDNDDEHFAETTAETLLSELKNAVGKVVIFHRGQVRGTGAERGAQPRVRLRLGPAPVPFRVLDVAGEGAIPE